MIDHRGVLRIVIAAAALTSVDGTHAADYPAPTEADFVLRDFRFASGETLPELRLHYRTVGTPRKDAQGVVRNAVVIGHGTGGSGAQFLRPEFADELFGAGQLLDAARYFMVLPDAIGHGGSSKPSDGLRARFPRYGYVDMVEANHRLLTEGLGVNHVRLVMGTSMGGMHTWLWGERHPDFMDALLPLASLPTQISGRNRAWRRVLLDAIRSDPAWAGGAYTAQPPSLRTATGLLFLMGSNPILRQEQMPTLAKSDEVLDQALAAATADANDVLYQVGASWDYDPGPHLEKIRAPLTAVNSADDLINPPELGILEREIRRVPGGEAVTLPLGPATRGHGSHTVAALWKTHLAKLLARSERPEGSAIAAARDALTWGQRLADSTIAEHPTAWNMRRSDGSYVWSYIQGLVGLGMERLSRKHDDPRYHEYMKAYVDHYVEPAGTIRTLEAGEFNIDSVNSGKLLFPLLDDTGDPRYRRAIAHLRRQLEWQPRTTNGVFWHKLKYPWQVWLDGLYMGAPFYAEYARRFGRPSELDDVARQFRESYAKLRDPKTGLLYHGWDESRVQRWSDPNTGRSPAFWTRSMGWYAMALCDAYEQFPAGHAARPELARMLAELSDALLKVQDPRSKVWWQVPDQGAREGNYLEASGSAMIAYAWAKGARLGMVEPRYRPLAQESFAGLVEELVDWDASTGRVKLRNVCRSAGLGGDPYRDGTYAYYVSTPVEANDAHGVGAFLLASAEIE